MNKIKFASFFFHIILTQNQNSSCLFNKEFEENLLTRETAYMQKRFAKPHHTDSVNRNLVRIETKAPFCFIKQQKSKDYDNCRGLASVKWGPNKSGEATRSHTFGEDVERYTMIDMQRRNPTNYSGRVVMDCGRPGDGYYAEKFPCQFIINFIIITIFYYLFFFFFS